jgi:hypothetical protein
MLAGPMPVNLLASIVLELMHANFLIGLDWYHHVIRVLSLLLALETIRSCGRDQTYFSVSV